MAIAAIWHFEDPFNQGKGKGDYPVAIVDSFLPAAQVANVMSASLEVTTLVVDASGRMRNEKSRELEVVDPDVANAVAQATAALPGSSRVNARSE